MDLRKLKTLIDLVAESQIAELEVTEGDSQVRIVKNAAAPAQQILMQPQAMPQYAQNVALPPAVPAAAPAPAEPAAPAEPQGHVVKSPMVGTFYAASAPGNPPYVEVGSTVRQGDTLCIIEAMKLLNEIEADVSGVIKQVLVENGHPVEYAQPLFIIG
ncbi:acetyl-CoA carboxylase biotin carboxyl carrier protein [Oxalobacter sp. OttesenSCG-928-P03]|nr:acetyl-CoA carboxylase biotin carboxyl carrier protein [Oxalobacter sp. OttesenSCG-928-P03]